ncbi:hypothetical protein M8C21_030989 [Ambrosia artemisiifolia]|uniref:Uncharacterized protein n=1 Tax=Ambrosia artemisiifolia TaxID=4212 RepID=A0AAD5D3U4_AMBAR|nr:hypothetical protein M8C21_030989 [Ambrosia artemisiifolia]
MNSGGGEVIGGAHDVLAEALGTKEPRGHVRGVGRFVTPQQYFYLPKTVKHYLDKEMQKFDQRFNKLEDEVDKLKRGATYASEAGSANFGTMKMLKMTHLKNQW